MTDQTPIRIFVGHPFAKHAGYLRVFEYLESVDSFAYLNTSVPDVLPAGGPEALKEELRRQIRAAEIVVVPLSVYADHKDLVAFQLDFAGAAKKPVLAIRAFGTTPVPQRELAGRVSDTVDWNERAMVDAIKRLARHEVADRWELVEFTLD